jgi:hypothetical protein
MVLDHYYHPYHYRDNFFFRSRRQARRWNNRANFRAND